MNLRQKILALASVPLIVAISAIVLLVSYQARTLSAQEVEAFESGMPEAKKSELLNYISLALTSIDHIYRNADSDDAEAQAQVKKILHGLTYGPDGYFFVYDFEGRNLVHPKLPHLVGKNWWDLRDDTGNPVIRELVARAREGGGYHRYRWQKPSSGDIADKISYAVALDRWQWMLGTGLYIDDVVEQVAAIEAGISDRIRQTALFILVIAFAALVVVFVTGIAINLHERRLADAKLGELTRRIIETQEEERSRVSRELHDGISQLLVSVKYAIELALGRASSGNGDVAGAIRKGAAGLDTALKEVRRISRDLRPRTLDDLGLSPALESLVDDFAKRTGIETDVSTVAFKNLLPTEAKNTLYRVAQEALTNIERHSGATKVTLELSASRAGIVLGISDNGQGFDTRQVENGGKACGIGLRNMRERLAFHGGHFRVESSDGGTVVEAHLPQSILRLPSDGGDTP